MTFPDPDAAGDLMRGEIARFMVDSLLTIAKTDTCYHEFSWPPPPHRDGGGESDDESEGDERGERLARVQARYETHFRARVLVIKQIELSEALQRKGIWTAISTELVEKGVPLMIQSVVNAAWFRSLVASGRWVAAKHDGGAIRETDLSVPRSIDADATLMLRCGKVFDARTWRAINAKNVAD